MKKLLHIIHTIQNWILIIALSYTLIMVFTGVVARYFFSKSIFGSDELIGFVLVFIGMFGAVVNTRDDNNIYMDLLVSRLPKKIQTGVFVAVQLCTMVALGFFIFAGTRLVKSSMGALSPMNRIPMAIPYGIIPVCLFLMLVELIINFKKRFDEGTLFWENKNGDNQITTK